MMIKIANKRPKRSQAALEFLVTYGWAFLVILVMIGALSYFGVLDPGRFLPNKCIFGTGIGACQEFAVINGTMIQLYVMNGFGSTVTINAGTVSVTGLSTPCLTPALGANATPGAVIAYVTGTSPTVNLWNASTELLMNISGCIIASGEKPKATITLTYTPLGKTLTRTVEGEVSIKRP